MNLSILAPNLDRLRRYRKRANVIRLSKYQKPWSKHLVSLRASEATSSESRLSLPRKYPQKSVHNCVSAESNHSYPLRFSPFPLHVSRASRFLLRRRLTRSLPFTSNHRIPTRRRCRNPRFLPLLFSFLLLLDLAHNSSQFLCSQIL